MERDLRKMFTLMGIWKDTDKYGFKLILLAIDSCLQLFKIDISSIFTIVVMTKRWR